MRLDICARCGTDLTPSKYEYCVSCNYDRMAAGYPNARKGICVQCGKKTKYDYCKACNDKRIAAGLSDKRKKL